MPSPKKKDDPGKAEKKKNPAQPPKKRRADEGSVTVKIVRPDGSPATEEEIAAWLVHARALYADYLVQVLIREYKAQAEIGLLSGYSANEASEPPPVGDHADKHSVTARSGPRVKRKPSQDLS